MKKLMVALVMLTALPLYAANLKSLSFMVGNWKQAECGAKCGSAVGYERWSKPVGGMMLGTAQVVQGVQTLEYFFMKITESNGKVTYTPYINGKEAVSFDLTKVDANYALFANEGHDFPKRLSYRLETVNGKNKLNLTLEGVDAQGQSLTQTYTYAKCDGCDCCCGDGCGDGGCNGEGCTDDGCQGCACDCGCDCCDGDGGGN